MRHSTPNLAPQNTESGGSFWTSFFSPAGRKAQAATSVLVIAAILVGYIGREGLLATKIPVTEVGYAKSTEPVASSPAEAAANRMNADAVALRELLAKQRGDRKSVKVLVDRINTQTAALEREFAKDRGILKEAGASEGVRRLDQVASKVAATKVAFVDAANAYRIDPEAASARHQFRSALDEFLPAPDASVLSNETGFRDRDAIHTPAPLSAGVVPAYGAPTQSGGTTSQLPRSPEAADLAATSETRVSSEIQALATNLGEDPVNIFSWVRNNVRFEPYYGIRKGANETLAQRSGSSTDQAALTVSLLRASHVPARFVRGVVEMPVADAANWLGVDVSRGDSAAATAEILAGGGIPVTKVNVNGQLQRLRFEQTWIEAYVTSEAYRGVDEDIGGAKKWVALDPSIKRNVLTGPTANYGAEIESHARDFASVFARGVTASETDGFQIQDLASVESATLTLFQAASDELGDDFEVEDLGAARVAKREYPYLPSSLPANVRTVSGEYRGIPDSLQARVRVEVLGSDPRSLPVENPDGDSGGFSYERTTAELADRRVTVAYSPATEQDAEVVDAYHGLLGTPAYGASLVPVLRVGGEVVARGSETAGTGYVQRLRLVYKSPGFAAETVDNSVTVGSLSAIALDLGTSRLGALGKRAELVENLAITPDNVLTDRHIGEVFSLVGGMYFLQGDRTNHALARIARVSASRALSGAIVATGLSVATVAGFPVRVALRGTTIDVDQDVQSVVSLQGDSEVEDRYLEVSGSAASFAEAQAVVLGMPVPDPPTLGISTTTVLGEAARQGVPIHRITTTNANVIETLQHPQGVIDEVRKTVAAGDTVLIPQTAVNYRGWRGSAYVLERENGADYRISGGLNGGLIPWPLDTGNLPADAVIYSTQWAGDAIGTGISDRVRDCARGPFTGVAAIEFAIWALSSTGGGAIWLAGLAPWAFAAVALLFVLVFLTLYINLINQMYRCVFNDDEGWW